MGSVNRDRIETFKRTRKYSQGDYDLLVRVVSEFDPLYTLAHVMAEVSNLTDLPGPERLQARFALKETLAILHEPALASVRAAQGTPYEFLGLTDAAIAELARESGCEVLTDDLDLYLFLSRESIPVLNFTHLRAASWGI